MAYLNGKKILMGANVAIANLPIDQTYSPESENAQSGKAVAQAVANFGGGETFVTIANITLEEAVNTITIDENAFPDIAKVKDFYIDFEIAKPETVQNGNLYIKVDEQSKSNTLTLAVISSWNNAKYVLGGTFYSKCFDDYMRFNAAQASLSANAVTSYNLTTTLAQTSKSLKSIIIQCANTDSLIPVGSKIIIKGYIGQ